MLIQAALNGRRTRSEHPAIPITPVELAQSARESVAAGATSLHFHVRSSDGRESLLPDDAANALTTVRSSIPGIPLGVSTGAWILSDTKIRHQMVTQWAVLPDFVSVNFKEEGAAPLADLLLSRGVDIEAGLSDTSGADALMSSGLASKCFRLLLEPFEDATADALRMLQEIETIVDRLSVKANRLLHGMNNTAWELIDVAAARGYDTRVGFEDVLTLPDGKSAPSNAALVSEALRRTRVPAR